MAGGADRAVRREAAIRRRRRRIACGRLAVLLAGAALVLSGSATALPQGPDALPDHRGAPVRHASLLSNDPSVLSRDRAVAHRAYALPRPRAQSAPLKLSDAQLAGQRVIYSYSGLTPPAHLLAQIRGGQAAGVIFFGDNISSLSQIRGVVRQLRRASAQSRIATPLLLMTDQEGGLVHRLPGAPVQSEKQVGQSPRPDDAARSAGRGAGRTLAGVGMNVNLAPVLDVYRSPGNFIDEFGRSYSNHAGTAARLGAEFITAQQSVGVAATAKHFPGLGAAAAHRNTDVEPVTLNVSLRTLRAVDELPYQSAIRAGTKLVMVSWATYPAIDRWRPAGLSSAVVSSELRQRLHFTGVTITDALEAGALSAFGSTAHRAVQAAGAGMDLILCSSGTASQGVNAQQALLAGLHRGALRRSSFEAAANRVLALRRTLAH